MIAIIQLTLVPIPLEKNVVVIEEIRKGQPYPVWSSNSTAQIQGQSNRMCERLRADNPRWKITTSTS
ncbi:hypothetical protein L6164_032885 [Bauhinia variegata]|uniref:Uncharacterized protein n=1 Tax=Bauhinia variegata TaxID=167791 RepID=A0ACB9KPZ4_BAUVA|nr:hypothetical protein L6164_032885 [Bauhinia variegata]